MSESWVERHRPADFGDVQGNTTALEAIEEWIDGFEPGDPPQLLVGDAGTGKTSTAYIVATHAGLDLNAIDASTARTSDDVARVASQMRAGDQVVLLDECDSWHHAVDLSPLRNVLANPPNPVVMTANSEYDVPAALKSPADVHEFKLSAASRRAKLKDIAKAEGVALDEDDLETLVERPDLRSAINDLQTHARMGVPVAEDQREWDGSDFGAMDAILQDEDASDVDLSPDWLPMWLDQNARKDCDGLELAAVYDALSRADVHLGHAEPGDYRPWRYAGLLAEAVADLRLNDPYQGWVRWDFPSWVQSSPPRADDEDDDVAQLYRELKRYGEPGFTMSGGYVEFRERTLPVLRRLSDAERLALVVDHNLSQSAAAALDVSSSAYDDAMGGTDTVTYDPTDGGSALEEDW